MLSPLGIHIYIFFCPVNRYAKGICAKGNAMNPAGLELIFDPAPITSITSNANGIHIKILGFLLSIV